MATVIRHSMATYLPSAWVSWFNGLNCPLIEASSVDTSHFTVNIDDNITINAVCYDSGWLNPLTLTYDGSTTSEIARLRISAGVSVTVCYSDTFFYIQMADSTNRRMMVCYEKFTNDSYFCYRGGGNNENQPFYDLTNQGFVKVGDSISSPAHYHRQLLNYTSELGYIDIINHDVLLQNTSPYTKSEIDENFVQSSTIASNYVYATANANYYAVGTNLLVLMENTD